MSPTPKRKRPLVRERRDYSLSMIESGQHVLAWLGALRFATGSQVQRLMFDQTSTSPRMARHRSTRTLRRLFDAGFVRRVEVFAPSNSGRISRQTVNVLTAKGAGVIGLDASVVRRRTPPSDAILIHEFWLVELAVEAAASCPAPLALTQLWNDRELAARKRLRLISLGSIPDGLFLIRNQQTGMSYPCFLELDLGTESLQAASRIRSDIRRKVESYLESFSTPHTFNEDFGVEGRPIVLFVAESERRLANMRQITQDLGGGGRFWFSTLSWLTHSQPLTEGRKINTFEALKGPFWTSNWLTAQDDEWRSLATRAGA